MAKPAPEQDNKKKLCLPNNKEPDSTAKKQAQAKQSQKKQVGSLEISGEAVNVNINEISQKTYGSTNPTFQKGFVSQLVNISSIGSVPDENASNFTLSIVNAIEPRDELEALLSLQLAAVHNASMTFARKLAHVDNIQQQDSAERAVNKLMRTFTTQMEALRKYRSGGQQKVTVKHIHVSEGGRAIVGNIEQGGGG